MKLITKKVEKEWNKLNKYIMRNLHRITCSRYEHTLEYIFEGIDYETQLFRYVDQYREGYNTIDYDFLDDNSELDFEESKIELVMEEIYYNVNQEEFQLQLIRSVFNYFESNIEEEDGF